MSLCLPRMCDSIDWVILVSSSVWLYRSKSVSCSTVSGSSQLISVLTLMSGSLSCCSILVNSINNRTQSMYYNRLQLIESALQQLINSWNRKKILQGINSFFTLIHPLQQIFANLNTPMLNPKCCPTHKLPVILICLTPKCPQRALCLLCTDKHSKHDLVSIANFTDNILRKLQVNSSNPHKIQIVKDLNSAKQEMLQRLTQTRNKINASIGQCEDKVQKYFAQLFFSLAQQPHEDLLCRLDKQFTSQTIECFIGNIDKIDRITLGTADETKAMIYANMEQYRQKITEINNSFSQCINAMKQFLDQMTLAKPQEFQCTFNREKIQKAYYELCDGSLSVQRKSVGGSNILCLTATPFSPINCRISFKIERVDPANKSIAIGACLQPIVKGFNYCSSPGLGKGVYSIDQNCPYMNGGQKMLSSWNHHDTQFSQSHVGSSNLVGWFFKQGDVISLELDYYNSVLTFIKGQSDDMEDNEVYEMPIKLDQGPIYPYVSMNAKGDRVAVLPEFAAYEE